MNGWVWFILGAAWVVAMLLAWMLMRSTNHKADRMSDEWLEKRRREQKEH